MAKEDILESIEKLRGAMTAFLIGFEEDKVHRINQEYNLLVMKLTELHQSPFSIVEVSESKISSNIVKKTFCFNDSLNYSLFLESDCIIDFDLSPSHNSLKDQLQMALCQSNSVDSFNVLFC